MGEHDSSSVDRTAASAVAKLGFAMLLCDFKGRQIHFRLTIKSRGDCHSLSSVIFESRSRLSRIESNAFSETGLIEIIIPSSVEVIGDECFRGCLQLQSIIFERGSRLREVGQNVFLECRVSPTLSIHKCEVF
jgi:hypothetical protein